MVSNLAGIVETITSFFEQLAESGYLTVDYIFYVSLGLELVLIIFFLIKSSYSYELRLDRSLDGLNRWLYYNQYLDETNLIDFNNRIKRAPKLLRYHWQQYMLYREKEPSYYMSTYNLIEKPIKTSSFSSNIKNLSTICYTLAATTFVLSLASSTADPVTPTLSSVLLNTLLTPLALILFSTFFTILLRSWQNSNLAGLYQNFHLFSRYIDKSSITLPEYIDFEVLFTKEEIKRGIPVLNEFLEKRARQEQKELEEAMKNSVEHEEYDFSHLGLNGSQILDRAMKETEIYLNQRQRTLAEIRQLESEIESAKRNYENNEKEYERKMQASKENIERLRKQQEESTNRIESNYIRKQQTDEIKKQEQLEKDYESITLRYNQDINTLNSEITARKTEIEEKRQLVESAMQAEYKTFSGKVYDNLKSEAHKKEQEEKERLLTEKENYADLLQQSNFQVVEKDSEIKKLNEIIASANINLAEYGEFYNDKLTKEHQQRSKKAKSQALKTEIPTTVDEKPLIESAPQKNDAKQQYDEFGGYYDSEGYYRYKNGTYYDPQGNFYDEHGGHYDKDGNYFPPETTQPKTEKATSQAKQSQTTEPVYDSFGGYLDSEGYYRYKNGTYYDPQGNFHDKPETKVEEAVEQPKIEVKAETTAPRKRGRPRKVVAEETKVEETTKTPETETPKTKATAEESTAPRKRGRPRKVVAEETKVEETVEQPKDEVKTESTAPRKRGRPRKVVTEETKVEDKAETTVPRKRGRPRKVVTEETKVEDKAKTSEAETPKTKATAEESTAPRKRGRPRKESTEAEDKKRATRGKALKKRTPSKTITPSSKKEDDDKLKELEAQIRLENENLKQQHEELRKQIDSTLNEIDTIPDSDDEIS